MPGHATVAGSRRWTADCTDRRKNATTTDCGPGAHRDPPKWRTGTSRPGGRPIRPSGGASAQWAAAGSVPAEGHRYGVGMAARPPHQRAAAPCPGAHRRRAGPGGAGPRAAAQPPRAGPLRGDVERALLLQVLAASTSRLPTEGARVLVGPGENAGVVDAGDGIAVAIRIESHNHPSAIEPYQGAATGVGGILRDIFTMGARPLAVMDPLFFGPLDDARSAGCSRGWWPASPATATRSGVPDGRGRAHLRPLLRPEPAGERALPGRAPGRAAGAGRGPRGRATWPCCWARPPGATGSAG